MSYGRFVSGLWDALLPWSVRPRLRAPIANLPQSLIPVRKGLPGTGVYTKASAARSHRVEVKAIEPQRASATSPRARGTRHQLISGPDAMRLHRRNHRPH